MRRCWWMLLVLWACGGGGGSATPNPDSGPDVPGVDIVSADAPAFRMVIGTTDLPVARVAMAYDVAIDVEAAFGAVAFSLSEGELPAGLELGTDGRISGAATESGDFSFVVEAADELGSTTAGFELHVPPVVLMSGFDPFGGYPTNPSWEALRGLNEELVAGLDVRVVEIPVTWAGAWPVLLEAVETLNPLVLIPTGMAGTNAIRYETRAKNEQWGEDNDGVLLEGEPIIQDGPHELATGLPVAEMSDAVKEAGYSIAISDDAGLFLCNHVFYHAMYYASLNPPLLAGFVHVPPAPFEGDFTVADITAAHEAGLATLAAMLSDTSEARKPTPDTATPPVYFLPGW